MSMYGANPEQLDALANRVHELAQSLAACRSSLTGHVNTAPWRGAAGDRFRHEWNGQHSPAMLSAGQMLNDAVGALRRNADDQRTASGVTSAGPPANPILGLFQRAERDVAGAFAGGEAVFSSVAGNNPLDQIRFVAQAVAVVAPFVPGIGPVVSVVASGVVLAADAAKMANTGKWDWAQLAGDGLGAAVSLTGAGAFGKLAAEASSINLFAHPNLFRHLPTAVSALPLPVTGAIALRTVQAGFDVSVTTVAVTTDIWEGDYAQGGRDSFGYVEAGVDMLGGGHSQDPDIRHVLADIVEMDGGLLSKAERVESDEQ